MVIAHPTAERERNEALVDWYTRSGRRLPWRDSADPYRILVSEVMSQQTQVARVVPRFLDFMARFPTVADLAAAPLGDVLAAWSGLGYNRRAVRLHSAAHQIDASGWPPDVAGLEQLPGVGRYTARAVAAFAFGAGVAAIDTNLRRVLSRWYGEPLRGAALEETASVALGEDAKTWNQAVMDLGAELCRPRRPHCAACPVASWCAGPEVYEPPRSQPPFEGSRRQIRGLVVRALVHSPATLDQLASGHGLPPGTVAESLDDLVADGLVERHQGGYRVPGGPQPTVPPVSRKVFPTHS